MDMRCSLALLPMMIALSGFAQELRLTEQIIVDHLGWRASSQKKMAIFADPVEGQNKENRYTPGEKFELRREDSGDVVFTGTLQSWREGAMDALSGDRVWQADFSGFREPGIYYLVDPVNGLRSHSFRIDDQLYRPMMKHAMRTYYYQRAGVELLEEHAGRWAHGLSYPQDSAARLRRGNLDAGEPRDLSGGWFDAGDPNKYIPYLQSTLWELMMAYELNPCVFTDDYGIPESGNGVPDLLDELRFEIQWMRKMQLDDGSVLNRMSGATYNVDFGDPAKDTQARYYTRSTSWATAVYAASLAKAAGIFAAYEEQFPGYSAELRAAALRAWAWLEENPELTPENGLDGANLASTQAAARVRLNNVEQPDNNYDRRSRLHAAAELFRLTGDAKFRTYFEGLYRDIPRTKTLDFNVHPYRADGTAGYIAPGSGYDFAAAWWAYMKADGADPAIAASLRTTLVQFMTWILEAEYRRQNDPYNAFMWNGMMSWGSNSTKARWGLMATMATHLGISDEKKALYREIAEEYVHYLHGRNPLHFNFFSNMGNRGAGLSSGRSAMEIYHFWLGDGSRYDGENSELGPAPGYLTGGPNQYFASSDFLRSINPPAGQPPAKAYRDWNTSFNRQRNASEESWKITEPAIYYQAAYVLLLSFFMNDENTAALQCRP
jgi:endoglucanase